MAAVGPSYARSSLHWSAAPGVKHIRRNNMNILALIAAVIGVTLMSLTVYCGNRVENRWLRYLAAITGIFASLFIMSYVPSILGDTSTSTSTQAGTYLACLIVGVLIIKSIFFRKKKTSEENA